MKHVLLALLVACAASPPATTTTETIDCTAQDQAAVYCAHVQDACCTAEGWTCNNARYVDWFAQRCAK